MNEFIVFLEVDQLLDNIDDVVIVIVRKDLLEDGAELGTEGSLIVFFVFLDAEEDVSDFKVHVLVLHTLAIIEYKLLLSMGILIGCFNYKRTQF